MEQVQLFSFHRGAGTVAMNFVLLLAPLQSISTSHSSILLYRGITYVNTSTSLMHAYFYCPEVDTE